MVQDFNPKSLEAEAADHSEFEVVLVQNEFLDIQEQSCHTEKSCFEKQGTKQTNKKTSQNDLERKEQY